MGRVDEDGYFSLTDRLKRMINASGFQVWPAEVEALLFRHPAVAEACADLTATLSRQKNRQAVIVLRHDARETTAHADHRLGTRQHGGLQSATHRQFTEALPKSGSGKVMWRALQEESTG